MRWVFSRASGKVPSYRTILSKTRDCPFRRMALLLMLLPIASSRRHLPTTKTGKLFCLWLVEAWWQHMIIVSWPFGVIGPLRIVRRLYVTIRCRFVHIIYFHFRLTNVGCTRRCLFICLLKEHGNLLHSILTIGLF